MSRRLGKAVFSHGIPVVLLVWIFHDLNLRDAIVSLKRLRWERNPAFACADSGQHPTVEGRRV